MDILEDKLALKVQGLNLVNKSKDFSLKNINLEVPYGSIVGLIGRNGAGKSTMISSVFNIIEKDVGIVEIFGFDYMDQIEVKKHLGFVFDEPSFSLQLNAREINMVMKYIYDNWEESSFFEYLERFNLPLDKKTSEFSFGMKKKLSLSIALSHGTKLLILDEITSGLDPVSRDEILCILLEFIQDPSHSVFISSHITSDLEKIADYIVFMDNGEIVLSEEKDVFMYDYGILRCSDEDLIDIDKTDIIAYYREYRRVNVLVRDFSEMKRKYKDYIINRPSLDEILLILTGVR